MRKLTPFLLLFLFLSFIATPGNATPIKAGDKCKKIGRIISSGETKLICSKQGKKRIWKEQVATQVPSPRSSNSPSATPSSEPASIGGYSLNDVAMHNSRSDCWSVIGQKVYDLTKWISSHPGGSGAIISICGRDGTSSFMGQHQMSARAKSELAKFEIGALKQ